MSGPVREMAQQSAFFKEWLPKSGAETSEFPVFFYYVNVGPHVQEHEMITDVFLH